MISIKVNCFDCPNGGFERALQVDNLMIYRIIMRVISSVSKLVLLRVKTSILFALEFLLMKPNL